MPIVLITRHGRSRSRQKLENIENEKFSTMSVVWATFQKWESKKAIISKFQNGKSLGFACHIPDIM